MNISLYCGKKYALLHIYLKSKQLRKVMRTLIQELTRKGEGNAYSELQGQCLEGLRQDLQTCVVFTEVYAA